MLLEISIAATILMFISVFIFRTNLQTVRPRNWAMVQAVTDSYMTEHQALSEVIPFEELTAPTSPWPVYPANNSTAVTVAQLPFDRVITGRLVRTRHANPNNFPAAGGSGTETSNPGRIESWRVESHLTYSLGTRTYVKSRSTVRTR